MPVSEAPGFLPDAPAVAFSPLVGRLARTDSFDEQRTSTFAKVAEWIDAKDAARALELLGFCRDQECEFIRSIMAEWRHELRELIRRRGAEQEAIAALRLEGRAEKAQRELDQLVTARASRASKADGR